MSKKNEMKQPLGILKSQVGQIANIMVTKNGIIKMSKESSIITKKSNKQKTKN